MPTVTVGISIFRRRTGHRPAIWLATWSWLLPEIVTADLGFGPESSAPTLPEKHSVGPTESHPALQWCLFLDYMRL